MQVIGRQKPMNLAKHFLVFSKERKSMSPNFSWNLDVPETVTQKKMAVREYR